MEITTIGVDIAKRVFQAPGVDAAGKAVLGVSCSGRGYWYSSKACRPAWRPSRPAARRITGHARSGRWAMRCGYAGQ